jgi:UDP-glucose 4-epimerase
VFHFAAFINVRESVQCPEKYFKNNVEALKVLLRVMEKYHVKNLVFSSSAAVYGEPHHIPIAENVPLNPINPYGQSKKMGEVLLQSSSAHYVSLRYFNAAGAEPNFNLQERHEPEFHLIPLVLHALAADMPITIYGNDYLTPDGTCVRDYVHVKDICHGHLAALHYLLKNKQNLVVNLFCARSDKSRRKSHWEKSKNSDGAA